MTNESNDRRRAAVAERDWVDTIRAPYKPEKVDRIATLYGIEAYGSHRPRIRKIVWGLERRGWFEWYWVSYALMPQYLATVGPFRFIWTAHFARKTLPERI
jgi:hypothetical protein